MKRILTPIIAVLLLLVFVFYAITFQVDYDEVAVLTTFEAAEAPVLLTGTVRSVKALPEDGVLEGDAVFSLVVSGEPPVKVTVPAAATVDNADNAQPLEALRSDIEDAVSATPLGQRVHVHLYGSRIILALDSLAADGDGLTANKTLAVKSPNDVAAASLFEELVEKKGSLITDAGLYFKIPFVQKAYTYSDKLQLLEDESEELQTSDEKAVIVQTFITWRIEEPYAFFKTMKTIENAKEQLRPYLRNTKGIFSEYSFDQLVNTDASKLRLEEIERRVAEKLRQDLAMTDETFGIRVEQVGIRRLLLPEQTTTKVFERMKTTRQRLAQEARSEGEAQAATINASAQSAKNRILAFAQRIAQKIRAEGDREAAKSYVVFKQNPELAAFLKLLETAEKSFDNNTQWIFNSSFNLADFVVNQPEVNEDGNVMRRDRPSVGDLGEAAEGDGRR